MTQDATAPNIIPRDQHPISQKQISDNALKVLQRLLEAGHQAYLVGGGVRDLLLGHVPKDFDVATSARPEEVRELFRNSRLIGRRFRLAHVRFGREIIEVSTFRSRLGADGDAEADNELFEEAARADEELLNEPDDSGDDSGAEAPEADSDGDAEAQGGGRGRRRRRREEPAPEEAVLSEGGMILRDNVYGTLAEDALRRDLTINALYYTPGDKTLHDFANGLADIEAKQIRLIGDPEQRYREDPVRMLRVIRFAAKLGFDIAEETRAPIKELGHLLEDIPPARLFDEVTKLLLSGHSERAWQLLLEHDLLQWLLPGTEESLDPLTERLIELAMENTDRRIAEGKPVTPGFQVAVLLWPPLENETTRLMANGSDAGDAFYSASNTVFEEQSERTSVPRRFSTFAREVWELQPRLVKRQPNRITRVVDHPRFRAAYDFLLLREAAGEELTEVLDWWTRFQDVGGKERAAMIEDLRPNRRGNRGRQQGRPLITGPMDTPGLGEDLPQTQHIDGNRAPTPSGGADDDEGNGNGGQGGGRQRNKSRSGGKRGGGGGGGNNQKGDGGGERRGRRSRRRKGRSDGNANGNTGGNAGGNASGNSAGDTPANSSNGGGDSQPKGDNAKASGDGSGNKRRRNRRRRRGPANRSGSQGNSGGGDGGSGGGGSSDAG